MSIQVRIFVGFLQTKEVLMHLNQSKNWKNDQLMGSHSLVQAEKEGKTYIGRFFISPLSYSEIKEHEKEIRSQLQLYCLKLNLDRHNSYLFPQLFIL